MDLEELFAEMVNEKIQSKLNELQAEIWELRRNQLVLEKKIDDLSRT